MSAYEGPTTADAPSSAASPDWEALKFHKSGNWWWSRSGSVCAIDLRDGTWRVVTERSRKQRSGPAKGWTLREVWSLEVADEAEAWTICAALVLLAEGVLKGGEEK